MDIGEILGYAAIGLTLFGIKYAPSRLITAVYWFLVLWMYMDILLVFIGQYYSDTVPFVAIGFDYLFIFYLVMRRVKSYIAPAVTLITLIYATICIQAIYFLPDISDKLMSDYGIILGVAALLCAMEGVYHGLDRERFFNPGSARGIAWLRHGLRALAK